MKEGCHTQKRGQGGRGVREGEGQEKRAKKKKKKKKGKEKTERDDGKREKKEKERPMVNSLLIVVSSKNRTGVENHCSHVPSTIDNQSAHFQQICTFFLSVCVNVSWNPTFCPPACHCKSRQR